ncbi:vacuolar-type H+-ATPase subunit I/STV1 [Roseateles asaccharophilus]|uniref:hypothetical protein n=1 Tax=Roseateles asaccharophilus TaxID=582607 RepID=UPI0038358311
MNGFESVLNQLGLQAGDFMSLVTAFAYTTGILFVAIGIYAMTKAADPSARSSYSGWAWWWSLAIGCMLFALPQTMAALGGTFFDGMANTNPLVYTEHLSGNLHPGSCTLSGIRPLLMVIGYIAVIRGLIVFRSVGMYGNHSHGASVGKGSWLCIAGIALVHMQQLLQMIQTNTGLKLGEGLC